MGLRTLKGNKTMKFRKKPVVIEAEQFLLGSQPYPEEVVPVWVDSRRPGIILALVAEQEEVKGANKAFGIRTLEGWYVVTHGDWIITGVKGEHYPCKPDIFEATYEPI